MPLGLFNTKDEPNRSSRISAIQKYGIQGSISGVFPQYADDLPVMNPNTSEADLGSAVAMALISTLLTLHQMVIVLLVIRDL